MKLRSADAVRYIRAATLGGIGVIAWMATAQAGQPVAIVESVSGQPSGIEFMDYVETGKVINLGSRDRIVLDYLRSCWRETIAGGTVTVGTEQSRVQSGSVERVRIKCDGGHMALSPEQAVESAGLISRSMEEQPDSRLKTSPQVTLYARIPMIDVRAGDTLLIERIDKPGERLKFTIEPARLARGAFYDFANTDRVLAAGGIYRATLGAKQIVFKVDAAAPLMAPLGSRLLRF
jgi:hypothetical protein